MLIVFSTWVPIIYITNILVQLVKLLYNGHKGAYNAGIDFYLSQIKSCITRENFGVIIFIVLLGISFRFFKIYELIRDIYFERYVLHCAVNDLDTYKAVIRDGDQDNPYLFKYFMVGEPIEKLLDDKGNIVDQTDLYVYKPNANNIVFVNRGWL